MKVTILGCGGSEGVPSATGDWGFCDPSNPRNYRRRPAVLVEVGAVRILIDTPPELREQLSSLGVEHLDAVLLTHGHADHLHGIDDLRSFSRRSGKLVPVFGDINVIDELRHRFGYAISDDGGSVYRPIIAPNIIEPWFEVAGIEVGSFPQDHGFGFSTGYRIGNFGYSIDVVSLSDNAVEMLAGIDLWVVDCQQIEPHPSHSHLRQTLDWVDRIKPRQAVLTHMGSRLDYASLSQMLPRGIEPGYDGMRIELSQSK